MAQNTSYKDTYELVDAGLATNTDVNPKFAGYQNQTPEPSNLDSMYKNWWLRTSWTVDDNFRGILGRYYIDRREFLSLGDNRLSPAWLNGNNGNVASPIVYDILEDLDSVLLDDSAAAQVGGSGDPNIGRMTRYRIRLDNTTWNQGQYDSSTTSTENLLLVENYNANWRGDPNWERFLTEGIPMGGASVGFSTSMLSPPIFPAASQVYSDFVNSYLKPSNNEFIRAASGMDISVEGVYNFYADTTPPYETVIANGQITETMLTNYYCFTSELRYTGSIPAEGTFDPITNQQTGPPIAVRMRHAAAQRQITIDDALLNVDVTGDGVADPWFVQGPGGASESKTQEFYALYSKGLAALLAGDIASKPFGQTRDEMKKYKNFAILCTDSKFLNDLGKADQTSQALVNIPFYNKLTIGINDDAIANPDDVEDINFGFFENLAAAYAGDDFNGQSAFGALMNMIQLAIIASDDEATGTGDADVLSLPPGAKQVSSGTVESTTDPGPTATWLLESSTNLPATTTRVFHWNRLLRAINLTVNNIPSSDRLKAKMAIRTIISQLQPGAFGAHTIFNVDAVTNTFLLRNDTPIGAAESLWRGLLQKHTAGAISYPRRDFADMLNGDKCYSETVLYKIKKYRILVTPGGAAQRNHQQTFYISPRDENWTQIPIHYIDTQVKYGVEYEYEIEEMRLVFGNEYQYDNIRTFFAGEQPSVSRAIGLAMGAFEDRASRLEPLSSIMATEDPYLDYDEDWSSATHGWWIYAPELNPVTGRIFDINVPIQGEGGAHEATVYAEELRWQYQVMAEGTDWIEATGDGNESSEANTLNPFVGLEVRMKKTTGTISGQNKNRGGGMVPEDIPKYLRNYAPLPTGGGGGGGAMSYEVDYASGGSAAASGQATCSTQNFEFWLRAQEQNGWPATALSTLASFNFTADDILNMQPGAGMNTQIILMVANAYRDEMNCPNWTWHREP